MRRGAVLVAVLALLAACTDIPSSSAPQRVESVPAGAPASTPQPPPKNASQRLIVQLFLDANRSTEPDHAAARQFLTANSSRTWRDTTVTVVGDIGVGDYDPASKSVVVTGGVVGTVAANGVYTPSLDGTGTGGPLRSFEFGITSVNGQYRIDRLPSTGLLLDVSAYNSIFQEFPLYFFDESGHYLVPDLRSSALEGRALQDWLLRQLVAGPRLSLVDAVDTDTFPAPTNTPPHVVATRAPPLEIEVPGASGLDDDGRRRLGAQIARTLERAAPPNTIMTVTDNGMPVSIKVTGGSQFAPSQFGSIDRPAPPPELYYLLDGRIRTAAGRALGGKLATAPDLQTLAVARRGAANLLHIAGTANGQLYTGTSAAGLTSWTITGVTSRPAWAPGLDEVWVGAGARLYRADTDTNDLGRVDITTLPQGAQIIAVRLSPEGSRVAIVVRIAATGAQQLLIGSVSRSAGQVQVSALELVSPRGVGIIDVGWIEATRLFSIGYRDALSSQIFEENVDGSGWEARGIANLPGGPDYATVVSGHVAWVSAQGEVWRQSGVSWESPGPGSPTFGEAPVYLE